MARFVERFLHQSLHDIFFLEQDLILISDPRLTWLNAPPDSFLEYARTRPSCSFDGVPPDEENYRRQPTFLIQQVHRIWLIIDTVRRFFPNDSGKKILDLGSYPFAIPIAIRDYLGSEAKIVASVNQTLPEEWAEELNRRGAHVIYTNLDPLVLSGNDSTFLEDVIAADDNSIDAVLLCHVIEHLYHPMIVLKEIHRVLRPQGRLLVATDNAFMLGGLLNYLWNGEYLHEPVESTAAMSFHSWRGHNRFYSANDLRVLLESARFHLLETRHEEVLYNSFLEEYFKKPHQSLPEWRVNLLTAVPEYRNEILVVAEK
jgi:SAM-dependent methyltransferase